jgi:hexosaminidase
LLGWDEITEGGTPPGAVVVGWRGTSHAAKAAIAGHDVIMAPTSHTYFDNYQSDAKTEPLAIGGPLTLEKVYDFEPVPQDLPIDVRHRVLGGQAQLWSEYIPNFEHLIYMAFPRACALAEALWLEKSQMSYGDFVLRMVSQKQPLQARIGRIGPIPESQ